MATVFDFSPFDEAFAVLESRIETLKQQVGKIKLAAQQTPNSVPRPDVDAVVKLLNEIQHVQADLVVAISDAAQTIPAPEQPTDHIAPPAPVEPAS